MLISKLIRIYSDFYALGAPSLCTTHIVGDISGRKSDAKLGSKAAKRAALRFSSRITTTHASSRRRESKNENSSI
jgi:hypothetical protein